MSATTNDYTESEVFKTCSLCETEWGDLVTFVRDEELTLKGYQPKFGSPENGLFLLTHSCEGCGSTLAIKAGMLKELHGGPFYDDLNVGKDGCERHCINQNSFEPCDQECSMRWVRDILQILKSNGAPVEILSKNNTPLEIEWRLPII